MLRVAFSKRCKFDYQLDRHCSKTRPRHTVSRVIA